MKSRVITRHERAIDIKNKNELFISFNINIEIIYSTVRNED